MGPLQALGALMLQGSSLPPWSQVDTHPQTGRISPNLNILRPLLGPDGVARPSHSVTFLQSGKRWGHQAGAVPAASALAAPQHFAFPLQDPKNGSEGILAWMSSGQGKARDCLCLLHHILCPSPESLSLSGQGHSSCKTRWLELMLQPSRDAEVSEHHPRACAHSEHPPHPHDTLGLPALYAWVPRYLRRHCVPAGSSQDGAARLASCRQPSWTGAQPWRLEANHFNPLRCDYYKQT